MLHCVPYLGAAGHESCLENQVYEHKHTQSQLTLKQIGRFTHVALTHLSCL